MSPPKALHLAAVVGCFSLSLTDLASADPVALPVPLTSGTVEYKPPSSLGGPLRLFGPDFSLVGGTGLGDADPGCCLSPGTTTQPRGFWGGGDVNGTLTYLGQTFTHLGDLGSSNNVNLTLLSSPFALPPAPPGPMTVTLSAPFALVGSFVGAPGTGIGVSPTVSLLFYGVGIGSLPFRFHPAPEGFWDPIGPAVLRIGSTAELVPEPGTLLLFGLGLAGVYRTRYRRHSNSF